MEDSWANLEPGVAGRPTAPSAAGLDLHLELTGPRVRAGLENALRQAVQDSRLTPGMRLPATRTLAADLGVARNTVADAYGQLVAEGWLTARQGSGTRVAEHVTAPAEHLTAPAKHVTTRAAPGRPPPAPPTARPAPAPPTAPPTPAPPAPPAPRYDLRPGVPDLSEFPRASWLAAARRAVSAAPSAAFGYGDPRGRPELRAALASYLARARGVRATPDQIVVCSGFSQGLSLLSRVLAASGAPVMAVEAFGHLYHRQVITAQGLSAWPVPVDDHGAVIDALGQVPGAGALLLTPSHQFPLGVPLAPARRSQAVRWAARTGAVLIEDDYDGEFRYDRRAIGAMQALAPEHVVYAGTASKTLAPAVRLAWLVLPGRLLADVVAAKSLSDRHGSSLDELTLAELIASGGYDRHVRRSRLRYRRRRDRLIDALAQVRSGPRVTGLAAGLHAVLHLAPGRTEADVVAAAAARGLAVDGMRGFRSPGIAHPEALVLGYGTPPAHAFTTAITRLRAVLQE